MDAFLLLKILKFMRMVSSAGITFKKIKKVKQKADRGGIRTRATEVTGALNQRLRPLGHPSW